ERMLMGWIRRIMINNAIDQLRKNNMQPDAGFVSKDVWEETNNSDDADQLLLYKDLMNQVRKLPPMYRAVFNMHVIDGLSHNEIAEILGIAAGTSKSNLWKARNLLQAYLKEQHNNNELCRM
ncbi:MAG: sigma-70 family RNA polymerase sigma factor, partial [Bacteroidota bacterium]|nr:sigma-70 family RNA polymerase sigma factor [Bacteroidota bacterium]